MKKRECQICLGIKSAGCPDSSVVRNELSTGLRFLVWVRKYIVGTSVEVVKRGRIKMAVQFW